ncbi:MAG: type V CRISPR-associated protein Cas4 [Campylobacteraceae bacterium]|jgi:CRISPR-associated protein Cas4|nr:type V CRISPR-associated protein Cas4 [Campylobacteraceae bacterium]
MMHNYIAISTLNDFIFCPYSIYLHNVYMGGDEELVHAVPQTRGKVAHGTIDNKNYSSRKDEITGLPVYCGELGIVGNIDIYKTKEKLLIERKYQINEIYQGQIYQLWAEYFCMIEMGYDVKNLAFYAISTNKTFPAAVPNEENKKELQDFILKFKQFDPEQSISINTNKCTHCIYCALCDKVDIENVYA